MGSESKLDFDISECVELIRTGSSKAFERLFTAYYGQLCRFVYRYVRSQEVAESLVQEVFVRIWEQRATLDASKNIRSFLYRSVRNQALDYLNHKSIVQEKMSMLRGTRDTVTVPEGSVLNKERFWAFIQDQVESLPDQTRLIYTLSRKDGLTYNEIADLLDISSKTVEYHISKAMDILRMKLKHSLSSLYE